jgi:hypothetical protein
MLQEIMSLLVPTLAVVAFGTLLLGAWARPFEQRVVAASGIVLALAYTVLFIIQTANVTSCGPATSEACAALRHEQAVCRFVAYGVGLALGAFLALLMVFLRLLNRMQS